MDKIKSKKKWVSLFYDLSSAYDDFNTAYEFSKQGEMSDADLEGYNAKLLSLVEDLEIKSTMREKEDEMDAVLEINAGAGGTDSNDWAHMIMRMYVMWGHKNNYKVKELSINEGDVAGIKSVSIQFQGEYPFGYLKSENGVHRLVRLSPFDSNSKRHTSFASVYVYPLVDEDIDIKINPSDIKWETFRSSGAGGQSVNKIETAVRLRYLPENIIIENSQTRSQLDNKEKAMILLKSKLYEIQRRQKEAKKQEINKQKKKIEWGAQIRNYVMHPYKIVKDLRTGHQTKDVDSVMNGDINGFLKSYLLSYK